MADKTEYNEYIKVSAVASALTGKPFGGGRPDRNKEYRGFYINLNLMVQEQIDKEIIRRKNEKASRSK